MGGEAGQARAQGPDAGSPEGPPRGLRRGAQEVRRRGPAAGLQGRRGPGHPREGADPRGEGGRESREGGRQGRRRRREGAPRRRGEEAGTVSQPKYYGNIRGIAQPATYGVGAPKK